MVDDAPNYRAVTRRRNFWARIEPGSKGCWVWKGTENGRPGKVRINGNLVKAHRHAWELVKGPIPEGYELWRVCQTTTCVNPEHRILVRRKNLPLADRFWRWVGWGEQDGVHECWEWLGGLDPDGYGRFRWGDTHTGAHRMAWELTYNVKLRSTQFLYHLCDNKICVRPTHLSLVPPNREWARMYRIPGRSTVHKSGRIKGVCCICGAPNKGNHLRSCKRKNPELWFIMEEV